MLGNNTKDNLEKAERTMREEMFTGRHVTDKAKDGGRIF